MVIDLLDSDADAPEFIRQVEMWVRGWNLDRKYWSRIWLGVQKHFPSDSLLFQRGLKWLDKKLYMRRDWSNVWLAMFEKARRRQALWRIGREWLLVSRLTNRYWTDIWLKTVGRYPNDKKLQRRAKEWLEQSGEDYRNKNDVARKLRRLKKRATLPEHDKKRYRL